MDSAGTLDKLYHTFARQIAVGDVEEICQAVLAEFVVDFLGLFNLTRFYVSTRKDFF